MHAMRGLWRHGAALPRLETVRVPRRPRLDQHRRGAPPGAEKEKAEGEMRHGLGWYGAAVAVFVFGVGASAVQAQLMIVGNDEKITFDENNKAVNHEPGKDSVSIVDISKPDAPKIVATFPLANSIVGPPTNLAIHPSGEIALIANSVNPEKEGDVWKNVPDDKISVIDLKAS